ncbi:helix-turn-helix domain-containing protein [Nocardioides sp. NBC_00850]|uniref:helix-turn-helix domain-containing protein n=1 Tax=Nocardioides sp. NBC_00850 TaxID=2976001 RepID=UPI00386C8CBB
MSTKPSTPRPTSSFRHALLTIEEAAAYLNVPTRWVAEAVRRRRIRCSRIGKHVRFRPEHLDELIAASEQPVTDPRAPIVPPQPVRTGRSRL